MILTFGKYKNLRLEDVPVKYLAWLAMFEIDTKVKFLDNVNFELSNAQHYLWIRQKFTVIAARAEMKRRHICYDCYKPLVAIGHARHYGANHKDWASRKLHKKCWKVLNS